MFTAASYGQLGFVQTIAKEGAKYNILASTLTALDDSDGNTSTQCILASAAALVHSSHQRESGHRFEVVGECLRKLRWQEAAGSLLNPDFSLSIGSLLNTWEQINDFSNPLYAASSEHIIDKVMAMTSVTTKLEAGLKGRKVRFDGRVVLVTGAGAGYLSSLLHPHSPRVC